MVPSLIGRLLWMLILLAIIPSARAESVVTVSLSAMQEGRLALGHKVQVLEDPAGQLTLNELLEREHDWQPSTMEIPNYGMTTSAFWFRIQLHNDLDKSASYLVEIANPILDYVDVHLLRDGQLMRSVQAGDLLDFSRRPLLHRNLLVPLDMAAAEQVTIYVRARSDGAIQLPIDLWESTRFFEQDQYALGLQILFAGIMLALVVYNFLLLLVVRDFSYLWYVLNVATITIVQLSLHGLTFQFLWPDSPWLNEYMVAASTNINIVFVCLFTYSFLDIGRRALWMRVFVLGLGAIGFALFLVSILVSYGLGIRLGVLVVMAGSIGVMALGFYLWLKGEVLARFYTVAWTLFLTGNAMLVLSKMGILPRTVWFEYAPQFGAAAEVLLLSFALAHRITLERQQRYQAQAETIAANERALQVQREANEQLESRVQARTAELEEANRRLQEMTAVDGLTQLKNRRFFDTALQQEWLRNAREIQPLSLLMLDMDHFKQINDTYGHIGGDVCLQHLAALCRKCVHRPGDVVARYGGEEFCILLCNTAGEGAATVAERVRLALETTPVLWQEHRIDLTLSIGIATVIPSTKSDCVELVKMADEALYRAKAAGRNRVCAAVTP